MSSVRTFEEIIAEINGISLEEHQEDMKQTKRHMKRGQQFRRLPPDKWPKLIFNWDLTLEAQRFALDGSKPKEFLEQYPNGFLLGRVATAEFDKVLSNYNRRNDLAELWECGSELTLCCMLAYLEEGLPITPPLVSVTEYGDLCLLGGNHRYTAAKFSGETSLPIYATSDQRPRIQSLIEVSWSDI